MYDTSLFGVSKRDRIRYKEAGHGAKSLSLAKPWYIPRHEIFQVAKIAAAPAWP